MSTTSTSARVVVIGGGPGGYAAAFRAADLGLNVTLVDPAANPGGVCLYRGCIPSKALLHVAKLLHEAEAASAWGVTFGAPKVDLDRLRAWKDSVVAQLTGGVGQLMRARKITHVRGLARFLDAQRLQVSGADGAAPTELAFDYAVLATGSSPARPALFALNDPRVLDSTGALELPDVPKRLLVIGGGYIGLELGCVYRALGSEVTVVEMLPTLLAAADRDLVKVLEGRLRERFAALWLNTKVTGIVPHADGLEVSFAGEGVPASARFDRVLVSVGRRPNSADLGLDHTRVQVDAKGFVTVDAQRRTAEPSIYAIGDVAGEPMLAHKASHEGFVAVESIAGHKVAFAPACIPAVIFTDPELAWCGLTEARAAEAGVKVKVARFPWAASGRALTCARPDGVTKLIVDAATERVLGVGVCGAGAGELIAEGVLAVEMAALATDVKLSIHAHPTLSETLMEAAELISGPATHLYRKPR